TPAINLHLKRRDCEKNANTNLLPAGRQKLPSQYHNYLDVFSKDALNVLPTHKKWDHKIKAFLGFYNFYRRFIKDYRRIARPLTLATRKDQPFNFNNMCKQAFISLKKALTSAPILGYFQFNRLHMLEIDASNRVVAAVLSKLDPGDNA
ncbi:Retrovirus-related Pol polyprotein from transposon, partial [Lachnellula subtilissima]